MAKAFSFLIIIISLSASAQKYMIHGNDTLPNKDSMIVTIDTLREGGKTAYKTDTTYAVTCWSFEKIHGQIVNQTDDNCREQGLWIITDSTGNYSAGQMRNSRHSGVWKHFYFDKRKHLIKESETVQIGNDEYVVKEINYSGSHPVIRIDRPLIKLIANLNQPLSIIFTEAFGPLVIILVLSFLIKTLFNSKIYNLEDDSDYDMYLNGIGVFSGTSKERWHRFRCVYTFWFSRYKPANKYPVWISNTLSAIVLFAFFIVLVEGMILNLKPI